MESKLVIGRNKKIQNIVNDKHEARANNLLQRMTDQFIDSRCRMEFESTK
uniref:Uncharacterized protein n=1 Tax=Nelumbo nucifera TaxID=4432 RepID=A0A822ZM43_NELNU|nr:TPA_asm: hypothetical protein HUJ06_004197 [Nelumbo nucifera]